MENSNFVRLCTSDGRYARFPCVLLTKMVDLLDLSQIKQLIMLDELFLKTLIQYEGYI